MGMMFYISRFRPKLGNGLLYFPILSQTPGKLFWFSHSRPEMQKVIPAHACLTQAEMMPFLHMLTDLVYAFFYFFIKFLILFSNSYFHEFKKIFF